MQTDYAKTISTELGIGSDKVRAVVELLEEGGTVPFIARYRKEKTGSMDEVAITSIRDRLEQLSNMDKRRAAVIESLRERDLLSPELEKKFSEAATMAAIEDLYLPFKPKRRTRATIAREKGLEPLAKVILEQNQSVNPSEKAAEFISSEKSVESIEDALSGARDIIAEQISEDPELRRVFRNVFTAEGVILSTLGKGKEDPDGKFRDYHSWSESVGKIAAHRLSAIFRGENEKILSVSIRPPQETANSILERRYLKNRGSCTEQVREAISDGYKRLLAPSMETETRHALKLRADLEAIGVFASNLRGLMLAPPLGSKSVIAIDPGIRTGCKVVILDRQGMLLHHDVIYISGSADAAAAGAAKLSGFAEKFGIEAIAIGNGTGGRETEKFVKNLGLDDRIAVFLVNESGASIYSASELARKEFPNHDLTVRGAVSIGRRLMDPLAELVKLDPKTIGVGQYQHDVDQTALKKSLDDVVTSCVNAVGVDLNTASPELLNYVSGLGPVLAGNIIAFRSENGPFNDRRQLLKVPRLGPKAFQQAAGFLRIKGGKNPLDSSAVHPEAYPVVHKMTSDLGCKVDELIGNTDKISNVKIENYATGEIGIPTLKDIVAELAKPGRDPRPPLEVFSFSDSVHTIEDLVPGQLLPGIVTNVTRFGAFVDIGVHQDGLVHISHLADRFVKDPVLVVKVQQKVMVKVLEVDKPRKRISLSMKAVDQPQYHPWRAFELNLK